MRTTPRALRQLSDEGGDAHLELRASTSCTEAPHGRRLVWLLRFPASYERRVRERCWSTGPHEATLGVAAQEVLSLAWRELLDRRGKLVHLDRVAICQVRIELADSVAGAAMYVHLLRLEVEARADAEGGVVDGQLTDPMDRSDEVIDELDQLLERQ